MGKVHFKHCDKRRGKPRAPVSMAQLAREGRLAPKKRGKKLFNTVQVAFTELQGLLRAQQKIATRLTRVKKQQSGLAKEVEGQSQALTTRLTSIQREAAEVEQKYELITQQIFACRAKLAARI